MISYLYILVFLTFIDCFSWKIIFQRIVVNICILFLLSVSAYAVVMVVQRSKEKEANVNWWHHNEITIVMSLISYIFPIFFELLGIFENYHPRRQLRIQLARYLFYLNVFSLSHESIKIHKKNVFRIMVLNLLNLYSLIIALFDKITGMTADLQEINSNISKLNATNFPLHKLYAPAINEKVTICINKVKCKGVSSMTSTTLLSTILTTVAITDPSITPYDTSMSSIQYSTEYSTTNFFNSTNGMYYPTTDFFNSTNDTYHSTTDTSTNAFTNNYITNASTEYENNTEENEGDYGYDSTLDEKNMYSSVSIIYDDKLSDFENDTDFNSTNENRVKTPKPKVRRHINREREEEGNCPEEVCRDYQLIAKNETRWTSPEASIKYVENHTLDSQTSAKLRKLCWETMFGQELVKLTVMDLVIDQNINNYC